MKHKETKYELPKGNQPTMVGESPAALQQYAEDLRYGMEVLSSVTPEKLHNIIVLLSDYTKTNDESCDLDEFVPKNPKLFISDDELRRLGRECVNASLIPADEVLRRFDEICQ